MISKDFATWAAVRRAVRLESKAVLETSREALGNGGTTRVRQIAAQFRPRIIRNNPETQGFEKTQNCCANKKVTLFDNSEILAEFCAAQGQTSGLSLNQKTLNPPQCSGLHPPRFMRDWH